jgi:hypothetical protein
VAADRYVPGVGIPRFVVPFAALVLVLTMGACGDDNNVLSLEEGQCFQEPDNEFSVANVEIVDCDEPHDNEIFHIETLEGDDDEFPGSSEIQDIAQESCTGEIEDFLGGSPTAVGAGFSSLNPTEQSWSEGGDREIVCVVFDDGGDQLDESLEGAAEGVESEFSADVEACEGGDNAACDQLYAETPVGSPEERVGATCGGRSDEVVNGNCVATLGD